MSSSYRLSKSSPRGRPPYATGVVHTLCTGTKGLLGVWRWERGVRVSKADLGTRVHSLWILRAPRGSRSARGFYAGYILVLGTKTASKALKKTLEAFVYPEELEFTPKELEALQYLEDPLCGDTGSFPMRSSRTLRVLAGLLRLELIVAEHDLAGVNPQHFRETYARSGRPRR